MAKEREDLIEQYELEGFSINVLSVKRTLVEKLLGAIKDSYQEDPVARLSQRIRHLYDICLIMRQEEFRAFVASKEFIRLCHACIEDEKQGFFDYSECLELPLGDAPLFSEFRSWMPSLQRTYDGVFADLVYEELPELIDTEETLNFIKEYL